MKITYSALALLIVFFACTKDEFETKPKIEVKSFSEFVPYNGPLRVRLEFRDKEGDVEDSLIVVRERLNIDEPVNPRELEYDIPEFPDKSKGEFEINIPFATGLALDLSPIRIDSASNQNDTLRMKFVVKDKAGNISDTAVLDRVIVSRTPPKKP